MKRQLATWKFIKKNLQKKVDVLLLYVLESKGSSPGRGGFFMAVNSKNSMEGSIGGGIMEHKMVEMAKNILQNKRFIKKPIRKQVHKKEGPDQSGMMCSGEQTIFFYILKRTDAKTIKKIIECIETFQTGLIILSPSALAFRKKVVAEEGLKYLPHDQWLCHQIIGFRNHLHIIGGGHCALALSQLMSGLGFYIHVYDNRKGLNTLEKNKWAHQKQWIENYSKLEMKILPGAHHFVVIMTLGYRTDDETFRAIVNKKFTYLGLLGSRNKIEKMITQYQEENLIDANMKLNNGNTLHAPVGISIKSQTPDEIAISIAAEIIKVKNDSSLL